MIRLPAVHDLLTAEPCGTGSPETRMPETQRPPPAQADTTQQRTGSSTHSPLPAGASHVIGVPPRRMTGAAAGTNGTRAISLPARYIGMPQGDLKSDPHHPGVLTDETGQPYVPIGDHYYAVRNDAANGTWRAVRLQDRATPGIPVRRDPEGQWRPHHEVGMRGGRPIPTRTQIASDLRATQASLHELTLRRIGQRQHIFDLRDMLRGHETFRDEARADLDAVRSERDFAQGMAGYYARQLERGDPEPSMRTGLERMTERIEIMTGGMAGLQRLVDQTATHIATLRTMITTTTAELEHTSESILRARQRIEELESISSDVE